MPYVKPVAKRPRPKKTAGSASPSANGQIVVHGSGDPAHPEVPPPTITHTRPPTPDEIIDNLRFMFAVGIECSNPVVAGGQRVDQLEMTGHYEHWRKDLQLVRDLGLRTCGTARRSTGSLRVPATTTGTCSTR